MTSNPEAGLLLTKSDLEKYSRKATSLKALVAKHSRARHQEVAQIIEDLLAFYESVKLMENEKRTPESIAKWEYRRESAADDEDIVIQYVLKQGPHKAHVERGSAKYL